MATQPSADWRQINLRYDSWRTAEQTAVEHLHPLLSAAEGDGILTAWWFIRKRETWRLRSLPAPGREQHADAVLARLADHPTVREHARLVYEPEARRFGGRDAMDIAHTLFHTDSRHILAHLAAAQDGHDLRRELGVRLATRLMNAAGQDFYEHGDIWAALAEHRTTTDSPEPSPATLTAVQMLVTARNDNLDSPLTHLPAWAAAFEDAGRSLALVAQHGHLTRGLRAILTDHVLFAFNRLGVSATEQALLAASASRVVFHRTPVPRSAPNTSDQTTTVRPVTMDATPITTDPQALRKTLVAKIDSLGTFRTPAVKNAFHSVPRHLFLPGVDLATAYAPKQVVTKRAADGTAVSSASSPNIVAIMLEQLRATAGHTVLEIGAATGINAALLSELVGPDGTVTTIELDLDLAEGARAHLAKAGYPQVKVLCRDGALGDPDGAPYSRIIVTAGAWDIPAAWWQQLAADGRLVVPLRLHGSGLTRSLAFDRTDNATMVSTNAATCGFVPMRGATEMGEIHVRLADEIILKVDADDLPDEASLSKALTHPAHRHWTGIQVRHDEMAAHLDLWLATVPSGLSFGKLSVSDAARELGLASPARRWSGAGLYQGGTLSYLTVRAVDDDTHELGIITHGPDTGKITGQVNDLLYRWSRERPAQPVVTAYPAGTPDDRLAPGARVTRPETRLTIGW
ncbi:methyltransferase, FxLD system [Streptomyces sp. RFCAC02]|uniref:methyltransferase, FxLD system n=1 Tax=Streptomyces sp. RFCAC02 TaxID=2499143 RepID=UPI00102210BF|nr:methyltransferase, FxLD system [Streptomyces sp. RFCAC02]